MIVVVNTRFLIKNKLEGFGWFSVEILSRLVLAHPEIQFYFLFDRSFDPSFVFAKNVTPVQLNPPARHPFLWYLWFEWSVYFFLKKVKADIFISTDGYLSLSTKTKTLLFWHDLSYLHFPAHIPFFIRKYYVFYVPRFLKRADKIITFSKHSGQEIMDLMSVDTAKIVVSHGAAKSTFLPIEQDLQIQMRQKYAHGNPYFLYVGALHPRKNVDSIIKAFDVFKQKKQSNCQLLLTGRLAWQYDTIMKAYENSEFKKDIHFLGHVESDLNLLIGSAHAMVYPSFYEGFGLPIIESIACHVPAITSDCASMPEVCGDAGILVNPNSIDSIAEAMYQLFHDNVLYETLKSRCLAQSQKFDWNDTANDVYEAFMSIEK
jgi:glycosyltransferase involved in cell wall biosynthesis